VLARLFLLLTLVPVIEIVLLVWITQSIPLPTAQALLLVLALVIGAGMLGAWLARRQGLQTLRRISADLEAGRVPAESMLDGLLVFVAAVLLVIPGLLTDLVAIVLLFPPSRRLVKSLVGRRMQVRAAASRQTRFAHDEIIDVKVIEAPSRQLPD
jgi:UPF0716 protein FxsA